MNFCAQISGLYLIVRFIPAQLPADFVSIHSIAPPSLRFHLVYAILSDKKSEQRGAYL